MARHRTPRVRLADIASRAGVSSQLVSVVLRNGGSSTIRVAERTASKVKRIADEMGYWPNHVAQQLRGKQCDLLGVLIGADSTPANFRRLAAIERAARSRGRRLMIGQFHGDVDNTRDYLEDFLSRGIDRLICFHNPAPIAGAESVDLLRRFRHTVFQTQSPIPDGSVVDVDRAAGVRDAVGHLHRRGRRSIALVLNGPVSADSLMRDRLDGYRQGLVDMGQPSARLEWSGKGMFAPTEACTEEAARWLVDSKADGVIASNDVWAIGLIRHLRRMGRSVPGDIGVVGFDNIDAAELFDPALTTIDQNYGDFAEAAVELAMQEEPSIRGRRVVQPKLVLRESA